MDKWKNAAITNAGISMLGQVVGGGELVVTRAALGGGTVDAAALMAQTALVQPLDIPALIAKKTLVEGSGIQIRIQIRNAGVAATQTMKQVGLFAKIGDGEEKLFAIMQDEVGEEIPAAASYPDFMLEFNAAVAVSNTDGITVAVSGSAIVTREELDSELGGYTPADEFAALEQAVSKMSAWKADKTYVDEKLEGKADSTDFDKHKSDTTAHVSAAERDFWNAKADKSDIPTKLPANGGNADTVGNKGTADLIAGYTLSDNYLTIPANSDLNSYVSNGLYLASDSTLSKTLKNTPFSTSGFYLEVYVRNKTNILQRAMAWDGTEKRRMYNGSSWGDWTSINNKGNAASVGGVSVQMNAGTLGLHQMCAGSDAATAANCPAGCWYGQYE